jgi:hypothetical protein
MFHNKELRRNEMKKKGTFINASEIKPGMIIGIKRNDKYDDFCLIIATSGHVKVEYTYLDFQDSYGSTGYSGSIDGKERVKVIKGKKRKYIFNHIKDDLFKYKWDNEHLINTLRLIESMDSSLR